VKRGGARKGFLKSQKKLEQSAIDSLKMAWRKMYEENSESVVVLNNGLEFQESSDSSVDMQLDQNKKTLSDEIRDIFHIFPNDFHQTFKEAIYPIVRAFECELNNTLLLEKEKKKYFFELDVKEIVRANIKERYEAYKLAKETGFMTINEIRRQENMEHIEGMDVINVGLAAVLYDTNTHKYYVPNKDAVTDVNNTSGSDSEADGLNEAFDKKVEEDAMYDQMKSMGNI
jgi:HK97 family phage portal protein